MLNAIEISPKVWCCLLYTSFTNVAVVDPGSEQPDPDKPDPEIPETGGPGIAGGILAGMAMVLLSAVEIVRRKRAQGM